MMLINILTTPPQHTHQKTNLSVSVVLPERNLGLAAQGCRNEKKKEQIALEVSQNMNVGAPNEPCSQGLVPKT